MPDELSLAVSGARYAKPRRVTKPTGDRQTEILMCKPGEEMTLLREPGNRADRRAIAVYSSRGIQIGYIVADSTALIHKAWGETREVRAVFQEPIIGGAAIRIAFDREPTLPKKRLADYAPEAQGANGRPTGA